MADIRSLLRAKRQETRISHRYASYSSNGQLRCTACGTAVKHPSAWEGHLGSKAHRTFVARLREEELNAEERQSQGQLLKRGTPDIEDTLEISQKKRKLEQQTNVLPADFFSEPADVSSSDIGNGNENESLDIDSIPGTDLESEYRRFEREVLTLPDPLETYEHATIIAEPQLIPEDAQSGFPGELVTGASHSTAAGEAAEAGRRRDEEERELILDRLLDEERAQEDADMRVDLMKKRLEAIKRKRQFLSLSMK
ncbi:hypothetical protein AX15_006898 [Amanita polypyramis BW_CC]|nr:hypothetical protein AX15_006898 [Amanita polypyramis BW_CC]